MVVEVTYAVPYTKEHIDRFVSNWMSVNNKVVLMLKSDWVVVVKKLQPHTAKDASYTHIPPTDL